MPQNEIIISYVCVGNQCTFLHNDGIRPCSLCKSLWSLWIIFVGKKILLGAKHRAVRVNIYPCVWVVQEGTQVKRLKYESYLSSEVRLMINTTRSILGRLSSFSTGRGRLLVSLLIGTINILVVRLNMVTEGCMWVKKNTIHYICIKPYY